MRVKDLAVIDGLKENQVTGFGLVVGLQGTGDSRVQVTQASLRNVLKNMGLEEGQTLQAKNVASVMLPAQLPPFVRVGDRIDITVSSIGDAKSLEGGILIQSPLRGADDTIYIVAQGQLAAPQPQQQGRRQQGVRTVAAITRGGIVERAIEPQYVRDNKLTLVLKDWDFAIADEIIKGIAAKYANARPAMGRNGTIELEVPADVALSEFIAGVQDIEVSPRYNARVVINERDGTIVMGGEVRLSEARVSRNGITIKIEGDEKRGAAATLAEATTVKDLVESLNYIGLTASDMVSILKALKDAGALHAELIVK